MNQSDQLVNDLIHAGNHNAVLYFSGGKDSTLLLHLIQEYKIPIGVLSFYQFWNKKQKEFFKRMIEKYNITVFSYDPNSAKYIQGSLVLFYRIKNFVFPLIMDHIQEDKVCGLDLVNKELTNSYPTYIWNTSIIGSKECDRHPLYPNGFKFKLFNSPDHELLLPLWNWTDEQVKKELIIRNYEFNDNIEETKDTGNFVGCLKCLSNGPVFCPKKKDFITGTRKEKING